MKAHRKGPVLHRWVELARGRILTRSLQVLLVALTTYPAWAGESVLATVGTATFQVEVATTAEERMQGLMFRHELADDRGMLFIQPPGPAVFWMKNTLIPLDLLYFDAEGCLIQIFPTVPPCETLLCPVYSSKSQDIRYILEINAGQAAQRGIRIGDCLRIKWEVK